MFKKLPKRNLRQRKDDSDEENDATTIAKRVGMMKVNGGMLAKTGGKKKAKDKSQMTVPKPDKNSLLSFDHGEEEEETEVFQLKKSSRSRRIAKHIKKLAQEEREKCEIPGGEYSKERLAELKRSSTIPQSLSKASSPFHSSPFPEDQPENEDGLESNAAVVNGSFSELRPGEIPDANRIHAARKQREMMRKYGADYIPVENTETVKKAAHSRLIREDDNEGSSGEDGPSVAMRGIIDDGARVVKEITDQGEGSLHRDAEFDLWEAEMIKKGISMQQPAVHGHSEEKNIKQYSESSHYSTTARYSSNGFSVDSIKSAKNELKTAMTPSETVADVKKKIIDRLECLQQVHRGHQMDADRNNLDITDCETSTVNLGDVTTYSRQYTYFQDMRAYVRDLIDCLNEKMIDIEALENRRHKIWAGRAGLFVSGRQQDVADESSAMSLLISAQPAPAAVDIQKQTRIREREARRSRRRATRERTGTQKAHIDGMSTEEEETSMDQAKFGTELEKIRQVKDTIFEDVVEEFYDVRIILSRFTEWKEKYPDSYNDAYIGLCLPRLLSPFVRLALLHWNPLERDCIHFEEMRWYEDLLFHGVPKNSENPTEPIDGDADTKLLSSLFEKVVLPKLALIVRDVWDPLSREQSQRLSLLLCRLVRTYPCMRPEIRRCNELLLAICSRIQRTIDSDIFIPLFPTSVLTDVTSGPGAFFERQTWTCIKLYENILIFNGILAPSVLYELAFTSLLNRYVMLSLQTSPITNKSVQKCQRICDAIPSEWLKEGNIEDILSHLASFSRYLLHIAKHIHSQMSTNSDQDKRKARGCMGQLARILSRIGSDDFSQQVAKLLGLKTIF